uniref:Uncharacterized protein n=1 Tax=Zea mays TaxID=4577 RepID=A0A804MII0_MAIZE
MHVSDPHPSERFRKLARFHCSCLEHHGGGGSGTVLADDGIDDDEFLLLLLVILPPLALASCTAFNGPSAGTGVAPNLDSERWKKWWLTTPRGSVKTARCFGICRLKFHLATSNKPFNLHGYIDINSIY